MWGGTVPQRSKWGVSLGDDVLLGVILDERGGVSPYTRMKQDLVDDGLDLGNRMDFLQLLDRKAEKVYELAVQNDRGRGSSKVRLDSL